MFEMLERRLTEISERDMMTSYGVSLSEAEEATTVVVRRRGDDVIVKPKYDVIQVRTRSRTFRHLLGKPPFFPPPSPPRTSTRLVT